MNATGSGVAEDAGEGSETAAGERTASSEPPDADPALRVRDLRKTYGSGDEAVTAVDGVSLDIERGSVVGLLGPNGAGKTTTIKSILGLTLPTGGEVRIHGVDPYDDTKRAYRHVGAMLEGARNVYWRLTVRENVRFFARIGGHRVSEIRDRSASLLEQFDIAEKADTPVRELSRGMKQKVSLACTLARDVDVAFLDEPTLGLDVESSLELRGELRRLADETGMTVVLSSHDMDVIEETCDRVVIMSEGRVVADDTVENLLDLFHTQTYEVEIADEIPTGVRRRLTRSFDAGEFERRGGRERFVVAVGETAFYDLVDALRDAGLTVAAMDAVEPDLEEVFLAVTDEDAGGETA